MMLAMAGAVGSFFGQQEKETKQETRLAQAAEVQEEWTQYADEEDTFVVLIDAGHGAQDSGKVGVHGELEKDINLQIANRLYDYLVQEGVAAVRTRPEDDSLYEPGAANQKLTEMRARCQAAEVSGADIVVSIHQNSYGNESVCGPQLFYYAGSAEGERLAKLLQKQFDGVIGTELNRRQPKANTEYYLLIHMPCPIVIAECGFLSNPQEAEQLSNADYQDRIAWCLSQGILKYRAERSQSE